MLIFQPVTFPSLDLKGTGSGPLDGAGCWLASTSMTASAKRNKKEAIFIFDLLCAPRQGLGHLKPALRFRQSSKGAFRGRYDVRPKSCTRTLSKNAVAAGRATEPAPRRP